MKILPTKLFKQRHPPRVEEEKIRVGDLIPPGAAVILKNANGFVYSLNGKVEIVALKEDRVWRRLSPLLAAREVEEVWLFEGKTVATVKGLGRISIADVPSPEELEEIVIEIIAATGLKVDMRRPRGVVDVGDWRVAVQLTSGGQLQVVATRLASVPPLTSILDPLTAARLILMLLRPSVVVIVGPPGSGKTTLLNSLLREVASEYPHLHVAVVEKYRELVFREGWFSWIVNDDLVEGVRFAMRYLRPDVLVVGEIAAEDFWSVVEPGRAGLPTITTFHAPSVRKAVKVLSDALRAHLGYGDENSALHYIDIFVQTRKRVTPDGVERGVEAIYASDGQRLVPLYAEGFAMSEEDFLKALPDYVYVGPAASVMSRVFARFGLATSLTRKNGNQ